MLNAVLSNFDLDVKANTTGEFLEYSDDIYKDISEIYPFMSAKKIPVNYISLDGKGINLRDGSLKFYKQGDYVGFISSCLSYGNFHGPDLKINITTTKFEVEKCATTSGLTIFFWQDYACELSIEYYKDDVLITKDYYYPDALIYFCEKEVKDWNRAVIEFLSTNEPFERIKLYDIEFGNVANINQYTSFNILEEINVLSDDLSINTCSISAVTPQKLLLQEGQELRIFNDDKFFGEFKLTESEQTAENKYNLESQDLIGKLDSINFYGSSDFNFTHTVSYWIDKIVSAAGIEIEFDTSFNDIDVVGWLPGCTCRYALTQLCWAIGGIIDDSRSDKLYIRPVPTEVTSVIKTESNRIIGNAVFKKSDVITMAQWDIHNYLEQPLSNASVLFSCEVEDAPEDGYSFYREFDKPTRITEIRGGNRSAEQSDMNSLYVILDDSSYDFIGYEYLDSVNSVYMLNPDAPKRIKENTAKFDKYTLYGIKKNSSDYLKYQFKKDQIEKYIRSRGTVTAKIILQNERVGDLITIETAFSGMITGIITSMNLVNLSYDNIAEIEVLEWSIG